jgi:HAD superfamily hydrolase (TIGR01484 family)
MKSLDPPIRGATAILSFDFDGTLHDPAQTPPVPVAFFEIIRQLREEQGVVWGINTGRSIQHTLEGILESQFPFLPDWVIAREHEIHFPNPFGRWIPDQEWNQQCEKKIHKLFKSTRRLLAQIRAEVEEHTGAQWIEMHGEPAGIISRTEEEMEWIVAHITPIIQEEPHFSWQRNSIYLRFGHRDIQKGSSLSRISQHYQLSARQCFSIGDSHNDLEMLDPAHAAMTACPANAVAAIRQKIEINGGLVTRAAHGQGAVEALQHYFSQTKSV